MKRYSRIAAIVAALLLIPALALAQVLTTLNDDYLVPIETSGPYDTTTKLSTLKSYILGGGGSGNFVAKAGDTMTGPLVISQAVQGNKLWLAMHTTGSGHTDAPLSIGRVSTYLQVGGREYNNNSYGGIGLGYVGDIGSNEPPVWIGFDETDAGSNSKGDFLVATRDVTSSIAPTARFRVTSAGDIKTENVAYVPATPQSLTDKKYVDTNALRSVTPSMRVAHGETAVTGTATAATGLTTIASCTATIKVGTAPGLETSVVTYTTTGATLDLFTWKPTSATNPTLIAATAAATIGWTCIGT